MAKVRGQLKSIWPDRTQYKPYAYNLEMQDVFVEVDIPDENVTEGVETWTDVNGNVNERKSYTLDLNGMTCLLGSIADAIDEMHLMSLRAKNIRDGDSVRRIGVL